MQGSVHLYPCTGEMAMSVAQKRRILIWGKTAPELSMKYCETVCTGGVLEDGSPVRLYPIPYRYMGDDDKFKKYQWITAAISRSSPDPRPESFRIDCDSIELGEFVASDKEEWSRRAELMFRQPSWQFESMDALMAAHEQSNQSLGVVAPKEITAVELRERPADEQRAFEEKRQAVRKTLESDREQLRLFDECMPPEMKNLEFRRYRIHVQWRCGSGKRHNMQIMDWEVVELQRKVGDEQALEKVKATLNLETHAIRFFLGNLKQHPNRFTIVGLWYPKLLSREGQLF
jgi:hypothetical protein